MLTLSAVYDLLVSLGCTGEEEYEQIEKGRVKGEVDGDEAGKLE